MIPSTFVSRAVTYYQFFQPTYVIVYLRPSQQSSFNYSKPTEPEELCRYSDQAKDWTAEARDFFLFSKAYTSVMGSTQPPIQRVSGIKHAEL
jgi:hypothetical protein